MIKINALILIFIFLNACGTIPTETKLNRSWVRSTEPIEYDGDHLGNPAHPIVYKNKVITSNSIDKIQAFNKNFGFKVWKLKIEGGVSSPILIISDYIFFTGYDGNAYSVFAQDGKILWKKSINYPSTQSLYYESGRIYIQNDNSEILSLEASSGEQVWSFSKKNPKKISVGSLGNFVSLGSLLVCGMSNGELVALEKPSGKVRWQRKLNFNPRFRDIKNITLYNTDKILAAGYDDHIYSVDGQNGVVGWKRKIPVVTNLVNMSENEVCFGTSDKKIICLNPKVGTETKNINLDSVPGLITKLGDSSLLFGLSKGGIEILNTENKKSKKYITPAGVSDAPIWDPNDSKIYFNSNYGNIYSIKLVKGNEDLF